MLRALARAGQASKAPGCSGRPLKPLPPRLPPQVYSSGVQCALQACQWLLDSSGQERLLLPATCLSATSADEGGQEPGQAQLSIDLHLVPPPPPGGEVQLSPGSRVRAGAVAQH
jgi:hypothetical protein